MAIAGLTGLGEIALGIGVAAVACAIVSFVLSQVGAMLSDSNFSLCIFYGQQALTSFGGWLPTLALFFGVSFVLWYFAQIGRL
jgi:hypothetical protein